MHAPAENAERLDVDEHQAAGISNLRVPGVPFHDPALVVCYWVITAPCARLSEPVGMFCSPHALPAEAWGEIRAR